MSAADLSGRVVALLSRGGSFDRSLGVAAADAGADVAFGTVQPAEEFDVASIANEVWSIGRRQFVMPMDAKDPAAAAAFAARVEDELGRADILVVHSWLESSAPFDQLSADEWQPVLESNMTVPFVAMQAFGRLMERRGGGVIAVAAPRREAADAAEQAAAAGLARLLEVARQNWSPRGIHTLAFDPYSEGAEALLARVAGAPPTGGSSEA